VAVDELDAEDLRLRERYGHLDVQVGRLGLVGDLLDLDTGVSTADDILFTAK